MKDKKLCGIMPALMTAFNENGVDTKAVHKLCTYLADCGMHGLYVGGSSGEMMLMNECERKTLLETVVEAVGDRLTVIAHVGAASQRETIALARHAKEAGAYAVSSVTPIYYKYSFAEVKRFYQAIAEASELPVIIYNIPALTGMTLSLDQLSDILTLDGIAGMKFTASDFYQLERLTTRFPDKVFYNGSDEMLLSGLAAGADGGIGTTYNFQPKTILSVYDSFMQGDIRAAHEAQVKANNAIEAVLKYGVLPSSKALLALNGYDCGLCREPFAPLGEEAIEALRALRVD